MSTATTLPPLLVDIHQASEMLGVSTRTVWALTSAGELPAVRIGRAVRYRVADLEEFCARRAKPNG
jgi:excisionase family DNA binding protein